jgi:hypothetical protein
MGGWKDGWVERKMEGIMDARMNGGRDGWMHA